MRLDQWLDAEPGRTTRLAAHFGVTLSAVSQWRANGVPTVHMLDVRELTNGLVTLEEMLASKSKPQASTPRVAAA